MILANRSVALKTNQVLYFKQLLLKMCLTLGRSYKIGKELIIMPH